MTMTILRVGESLMKEQISERTADFLFYYLLGVTLEDIENLTMHVRLKTEKVFAIVSVS